jgi:hypothetical protein
MIEFFRKCLSDLRVFSPAKEFAGIQDEISFFKEINPKILRLLLYFNKYETVNIPTGIICKLSRRFKHIVLFCDVDKIVLDT